MSFCPGDGVGASTKQICCRYVSALWGQAPGEKGGTCEPGHDPTMEPKVEDKIAQAGDGQSRSRVVGGFHTAPEAGHSGDREPRKSFTFGYF